MGLGQLSRSQGFKGEQTLMSGWQVLIWMVHNLLDGLSKPLKEFWESTVADADVSSSAHAYQCVLTSLILAGHCDHPSICLHDRSDKQLVEVSSTAL